MNSVFNPFTSRFDYIGEGGGSILADTKASILASTPAEPTLAFSTDTKEEFIHDGVGWYKASIRLSSDSSSPDSGWLQDSDKQGYGDDYIHEKRAYNFSIGDFIGQPYNGALKVDHSTSPATFELYVRNRWYKIVYDINMDAGELRHTPVNNDIRVWSGNSILEGLNNIPVTQQYRTEAGAYPRPTLVSAGELGD